MSTKSYKCPSCGAGIHFKPEIQKFHCDYCLSEYTKEEFEEASKEIEKKVIPEEILDEANKLASYECNSCGAKVVTDDTTTATFCYYCHNPVIISSRLIGDFKPNKMVPFTVDKEAAKEKFLDWAANKKFVPKDFTSSSQLEKITGIYLPYWWADCQADIDYIGEARKIRIWRAGGMEYTETKKYEIVRKGAIDINNLGELAFTKIDQTLLGGIGPYNENEAIDFSMPYLSGFFAEQYDLDKEEIQPKIEEQVIRYSGYLRNESVSGFNNVRDLRDDTKIECKKWNYTLLPTWILTYLYEGKTYVYAVNGQTGKSFGELPLSKRRLFNASAIIFLLVTTILLLGGLFIW